jgi:hypothetical protein
MATACGKASAGGVDSTRAEERDPDQEESGDGAQEHGVELAKAAIEEKARRPRVRCRAMKAIYHKQDEVLAVVLPDAVVGPATVMVQSLNTTAAGAAGAPRQDHQASRQGQELRRREVVMVVGE